MLEEALYNEIIGDTTLATKIEINWFFYLTVDIKFEITFVFGNCSNIILINTVTGIERIIPGTPQRNPQNISITKMVIIFIENDFPIKMGSKMAPNKTWTKVIDKTKKKSVLVGSNSTKANKAKKITEIKEPIIWIKLIIKANNPQKIGKLTSKKWQAKPTLTPVNKPILVFKGVSEFIWEVKCL